MDESTTEPLEHAKPMEDTGKPKHKTINRNKVCPQKRTRRGNGKKNKNKQGIKNVKLTLVGTNANGLLGKQESLKSLINEFQPTIITIQESNTRKQGLIKLKGYQIFLKNRENC